MNSTPDYTYADGNGNVYTITPTALAYTPVIAAESSSGIYSGGEPKTVALTRGEYDSIHALLEMAISDPAIHISERVKMSGAISMDDGNEHRQYIIKPGSSVLTTIETLLKEILEQ